MRSSNTVDPKPPENPIKRFPEAFRDFFLGVSDLVLIWESKDRLTLEPSKAGKQSLRKKKNVQSTGEKPANEIVLAIDSMPNDNSTSVYLALYTKFGFVVLYATWYPMIKLKRDLLAGTYGSLSLHFRLLGFRRIRRT